MLPKLGAKRNDHLSSAPPTPGARPGGLGKTPSAGSPRQVAGRRPPLVAGEPVEHGRAEVRRRACLRLGVHERGVRLLHEVAAQPDERVDRRELESAALTRGSAAAPGVRSSRSVTGTNGAASRATSTAHDRDLPQRKAGRQALRCSAQDSAGFPSLVEPHSTRTGRGARWRPAAGTATRCRRRPAAPTSRSGCSPGR